jgi:mRNA interferase HicA
MGERDDFLRELRVIARKKGLLLMIETARGKGSHISVRLGDRETIVPQKLRKGTFRAIRKDLGLD